MLDRTVLSSAYFTREKIAQHHISSFNEFLERGMQKVIDEMEIIATDIESPEEAAAREAAEEAVEKIEREAEELEEGLEKEAKKEEAREKKAKIEEDEDEEPSTYVKLGKIRVGTPVVREADGSIEKLYPTVARLRNITYAAPLFLEMTIVQDETEYETVEANIGLLPIMLMSKACNLHGKSPGELVQKGEDPVDPGGYFIVNGSERVIMTLEDLAPNKILAEFNQRYGDTIEVAKVFSQRRGYRALVIVERGRDGLLEVSFPSISGRINFVTLVRALGMVSDEEIVNAVSDDPEIVKFMLENLEEAEVFTKDEAMDKLGKRVAAGQAPDYQRKRANYVLDRYLLPHLGNETESRHKKAHYLARMAEACFELALGRRDEDDKDHYSNKRLKLAGDLMEDLFRVSFNRLARDIKYQLERANMRNRELNITTAVRSDVMTDRLMHPLATGNWVGGRTGVSQLLDRTDYMAMLSHLRRVISPLSRTQPHFEARDLHPTQWGRICPAETPEGPNVGLVKNFAQLVELSTGAEEEGDVKSVLRDLGVQPMRRASE